MSKMDERWETSRNELVKAAQDAGVDPAIMVKIAGFESGYNPGARPISSSPSRNTQRQFDGVMAISSAHGYGQFLNGTWKDMLDRHGEKYGVANASSMTAAQANSPELRNDTRLQAAMLAEFTKANAEKGQKLGGADADANVYAFHNLGDGDATKLLKALRDNPGQRVDAILSDRVIAGNPALYGNGSRTVAEAYQSMGKAMDKYDKYAQEATQLAASQDPLYEVKQIGERIRRHEPIFKVSITDGLPDYLRANHGSHIPRDAMSDGVLRMGETGPSVRALQERLNELSVADGQGKATSPNGVFDRSTREAVENFQLWNGLATKGVADGATLETARGLRTPPPPLPGDAAELRAIQRQALAVAPTDASHPDHAMLQQIRSGVSTLQAGIGHLDEASCERMSRSLLAACKDSGTPGNALNRVDHVLVGSTGNIFAVQGRVDDPAHKWVCVPVDKASQTPVEQSDLKLLAANQAISEQQSVQKADVTHDLHEAHRSTPTLHR